MNNEIFKDVEIIVDDIKSNQNTEDLSLFYDNLKKVLIKKLMEFNYVKLPPNSSIWTNEEQVTIYKNSVRLESRNILQLLYNFIKQNDLLKPGAYDTVINFVKETFGLFIKSEE